MRKNSELVLDHILKSEGGFAQRLDEPGGAVNHGITLDTFSAWRQTTWPKRSRASVDELRAMTPDTAKDIYRALYLDALCFDALADGVDLVVTDFAVNSGIGGALGAIQHYARLAHSAIMDTPTLTWCNQNPGQRIIEISVVRKFRMMAHPSFGKYGNGWLERVERVRENALRLHEATL